MSVLTTVHNGAAYIGEAVRSVLAQTFGDFEYIIVDDGSSDATLSVLDEVARHDRRVCIVHQPHRGIPQAANAGLARCRAPLVARLDADDLALPGRLEEQVRYMAGHDVVCAGSDIGLIDDRGRFLTALQLPRGHEEIQHCLLRGHCAISHPSCILRRDAVRAAGGYDERFALAEDLDLFLRLGEVGRVANMPRALTRYRLHRGSVSEKWCRREREFCREACEAACRRRGVDVPFEGHEVWRPQPNRESQHRYALRYGWWAFNSGERRTALAYGGQAVRLMPWKSQGWRLIGAALLKPLQADAPSLRGKDTADKSNAATCA